MTRDNAAITARNLSKVYKLYDNVQDKTIDLLGLNKLFFWHKIDPKEFSALNGINFSIAHGERVGIIGQNGAGKTTLLKLITGAISHTGGELEINGDIQALMQVGLGFHPEFSGRENITASLLYSGLGPVEKQRAEQDIIEFCELGQFLDQPFKTYSLGMQSRLQFACATAINPDILIVDEILGAGDAYFSVKSSARMERLTKSGCTLLLVSHSMGQVLQFCERVIWIDGGKIKRDGEPRDVIGEYEVFSHEKAAHIEGGIPRADLATDSSSVSLRLAKAHKELENNSLADNVEDEAVVEAEAAMTKAAKPEAAIAEAAIPEKADFPVAIQTANKVADKGDKPEVGESKTQLSDGQWVYRWPSEEGVKLERLGLYLDNKIVSRLLVDSAIEFRGEVLCEVDGEVSLYYFVRINSIDGRYVTHMCSDKVTFSSKKGELKEFTVCIDRLLLGEGEYYLAFNIIPGDDSIEFPTRRYDLVSNFCDFTVYRTLNYIESSIYKQPAQWIV
ncbi:MAG: polysaccharide ABC transporter ATP-binding protein [Hyphomicrobiaceae bacterium]|nr:polysaccharide ABC transporter ATP-binding protein [Hyphomicrobiaceae bacterium]